LWGRIGFEGAREHEPEALAWFERGDRSRFDSAQHAWQARAGLRAGNWQVVRLAIDAMPADMRGEAAWTYWYARALAGLGDEDASRAYFLRIAGRSDFYGLLASEELGYLETLPENAHVPPEDQVEEASRDPALARALELIRLGIRTEGVREWQFATRELDDARLLAASEVARRAGVWDRSIQAADRTVRSHNFGLRYPQPYREVFSETSRAYDVDMAWVLGRGRGRPDAGHAAHGELRRAQDRAARLPAQGRHRGRDQRGAGHRLPQAGARPARPPRARLRRLQ